MATQFSGSLNLTGSLNITGSNIITGSIKISGSIDDIKYIDFDTIAPATGIGRLGWDDGEGTLTIGLSGGNVNIPIGVTSFESAYNEDSSSISKGDVVRVSGAQGNRVAIKKANNIDDAGSSTSVALAAETIGVGVLGKVITFGPLKGIDTTAFGEGDLLYLSSTPGGITNIKPHAPYHEVRVGVAQRIHASVGIINIKVDNGYELDELHNVLLHTASLANKQLLAYSGSVWANQTISELGIAETASLNPVLAYTASLKGAAIVSSSQQIKDYITFVNNDITSSMNVNSASIAYKATNVVGAGNRILFNNATDTTTTSAQLQWDGSKLAVNGNISFGYASTLQSSNDPTNNISLHDGSFGIMAFRNGGVDKITTYRGVGSVVKISGSLVVDSNSQTVTHQITGSVNVTGSLTINSGSITMPNRPAFRVVGTGSTDRVAQTTLSGSYTSVDYNEGNHYNNSTGIFTAPLAGLYNVYFNGRVGTVNAMMQVIIYKNGAAGTAQLMWEAPGLAASSHFGVSGVLKLAVGDTLEAKVAIGSIQFDGNDSFGVAYIG